MRRSRANAKVVIAILIASATYLLVAAYGKLPPAQIAGGLGIYVIGFIPAILYLWNGGVCKYLPILPLHGLFYSLTFGAPALVADLGWWGSVAVDTGAALALTIVGLLVLYAAYAVTANLVRPKHTLRYIPKEKHSRQKIRSVAWGFITAYLLYEFIPALQNMPTISLLLQNLGLVGMGAVYLQILLGKTGDYEKILFYYVLIPLVLVLRGASGALAQMLLIVLFLGLIYWQVRKSIPWHYIAVLALIFIVLNPVKNEFRAITWQSNNVNMSFVDKAVLFGHLTVDYYSGELGSQLYGYTRMDRINHIGTFAHVIATTPDVVPYWGGETYKYLFVGWIPRVLWPGKPIAPTGNDFGRRYLLIPPDDFGTTYNLPWIIEFYANFGTWGVMVGMALVGAFFAWLVAMLNIQRAGVLEYSVALAIGYGLFYAESNLALMLGGVLSTWVALVAVLRISTMNLRPSS